MVQSPSPSTADSRSAPGTSRRSIKCPSEHPHFVPCLLTLDTHNQDKLRYVSTRRIHNAFEYNTPPFTQTVADDLDSLMQTFLNALLKRTGFMPCLLRHYGEEELWQLGKNRDDAYEHFLRVADDLRKAKEARERKLQDKMLEAATASEEPESKAEANDDSMAVDVKADSGAAAEEIESGPEGFLAMADSICKMMKLSGMLQYDEGRVMKEHRGREAEDQRNQRVKEHYKQFMDTMQKVLEAAELGEKRKIARKAAEKAEKEKQKAEEETGKGKGKEAEETEAHKTEEKSAEEDMMDVDPETSETGGVGDEASATKDDEMKSPAEAPEESKAEGEADKETSDDSDIEDSSSRPRKRARVE